MKDYYKTLGLEKNASKDDIKKAFRKLAHEHHPDKTKGHAGSEQKFKEASEAYSVLSDDSKRAQYDQFGSGGPGGAGFNSSSGPSTGSGQGFGGFDFSQFQQGGGFHFNQGGVEFDLGDIFGEFFGGGRRPRKGRNITVDVEISFKDSIFGSEKEISVSGSKFSIKIPPGIESGQGLRVADKGEEAPTNNSGQKGARGDLIVRIWVKEHSVFRKEAFNLVMDLSVKLTLALAGGSVDIETLEGKLEVKIPAGTSHGEILRVKGKGVPYETTGGIFGTGGRRGDLLIVTNVEMPKKLSKKAKELIEELKGEGV